MITIKNGSLTFAFPEISRQLHSQLEEHIQKTLPAIIAPGGWMDVLREMEKPKSACYKQSSSALRKIADALGVKEAEKLLRDYVNRIAVPEGSSAGFTVDFQRTMRIPDDGRTYPLPAGLGAFPLHSIDDFSDAVPAEWAGRGGVMMPMYQSEALWMDFEANYPFALKIGAGKINAVSGETWGPDLQNEPQNYVVIPEQPWLDGFSVGDGIIRQFVAMPLGEGYSIEEQLAGKADIGGIQLQAFPMKLKSYVRDKIASEMPTSLLDLYRRVRALIDQNLWGSGDVSSVCAAPGQSAMGLGAGGRMRQEIYDDPYDFSDWDQTQTSRCFVHLCNSLVWRQITGVNPPHPPLTAREYKQSGIPWFDYYRDDLKPLKRLKELAGVKTVAQVGQEKKSQPLPENTSITPEKIIQYGNARRPMEIREFTNDQ